MWICNNCGKQQPDSRNYCIKCGENQSDIASKTQQEYFRGKTNKRDKQSHNIHSHDLSSNIFDKVIGYCSLVCILTAFTFMMIYIKHISNFTYLIQIIIVFILLLIDAFIPELLWSLSIFRLSFYVDLPYSVEPSQFYLATRRIVRTLIFVLAVISLCFVIITIKNPPEKPSGIGVGYTNNLSYSYYFP